MGKRKINLEQLKKVYEKGMTDILDLAVEFDVSGFCIIQNLKKLNLYNPRPQTTRPKAYNRPVGGNGRGK